MIYESLLELLLSGRIDTLSYKYRVLVKINGMRI